MATVPAAQIPRILPARILLGWLAKDAAINFLMNECVFDEPIDAQAAEAKWAKYRDLINALPERDCRAPEKLPLSREEQNAADTFMQTHARNANVREVIKINPLNLVTHQPHVNLDQANKYAADAVSAARYARHSLAVARGTHNMAIRQGLNAMDVDVPHGEFAFAFNQGTSQFYIMELARHISVTAFQDRMLLWAGYHRSYAFIANTNPEGIERSLLVA